jgi:nitroreductase
METLRAIRTRRSIRKWKDKPVPDRLIRKILEAGRWGPSAHNLCLTRYVVIRDPETIAFIAGIAKEGHSARVANWTHEDVVADMETLPRHLRQAPNVVERRYGDFYDHLNKARVIIAVCADTRNPLRDAEKLGYKGGKAPFQLFDALLSAENMLLAIHDLGLGGLIHVRALVHGREKIARRLNIPKHWMLHALIPFGWPDERSVVQKPPLEEIVYYEAYPNRDNPDTKGTTRGPRRTR